MQIPDTSVAPPAGDLPVLIVTGFERPLLVRPGPTSCGGWERVLKICLPVESFLPLQRGFIAPLERSENRPSKLGLLDMVPEAGPHVSKICNSGDFLADTPNN